MLETEIGQFRRHVPAAANCAYFETASTGLVPDFVYEAVRAYQDDRYFKGGDSLWRYGQENVATPEMLRRSAASLGRMLGTGRENIFFGLDTSQVYSVFSAGLKLESGDNVILPEGGWMANRFAWQVRESEGIELKYVRPRRGGIQPEDVAAACDGRTRAVCLTLVESATGFMLDAAAIGQICGERGLWFAVDATQAGGVMPIDVESMGIDFLAANDYKWMMNFCGTGYGYVSPRLRGRLVQKAAGWMSDTDRADTAKERLTLREDAGRYEFGYPNAPGVYGLGLAAEQYMALGGGKIRAYIFGLIDRLLTGIQGIPGVTCASSLEEKNRSAIILLRIAPELGLSAQNLAEAGICAPFSQSADGAQWMRLSVHYYNNTEDIDKLIDVFRRGGNTNG